MACELWRNFPGYRCRLRFIEDLCPIDADKLMPIRDQSRASSQDLAVSILARTSLQFDTTRHDHAGYRVVERDVHYQFHDAAVVEKAA